MIATEPILAAPGLSAARRRPLADSSVWSGYWALTKPEVNVLIAITTAAAFVVGSPTPPADMSWMPLLHTVLGTVLVAGGAATLNQWMEHRFDARMRRTARRPIAAGRIDPFRALLFGTSLSLGGIVHLLIAAGPLASLLALATLLSYLLLYTPSKRVTPLCTAIGAVAGAMPPLIGWAAARGRLDPEAWVLFAIVFLWQFPHFMAIAWMYRDDYDRAGYLVLPRGEARVRFVVWQTLLPLLTLLGVSMLLVSTGESRAVYRVGALVLGLGFSFCGAQFVRRRSGAAARRLLTASIVYLPLLFALMFV